MKLNLLQRLAVKAGVPISLLNEFAHEYYGYPIPNEEGKYPEWWYREQRVPITYRDAEVPKEIIKKSKHRNRYTSTPKVYVKVQEGKVVQILGKEAVQTVPNYGSRAAVEQQQQRYAEMYQVRREYGEGGLRGVEREEIVHRVVQGRENDARTSQPRLSRATSVPNRSRVRDEDDIMSFIHDDATYQASPAPQHTSTTIAGGAVNPGALLYDEPPTSPPFQHLHRSTTVPTPRHGTFPHHDRVFAPQMLPRGPALPSTPRPLAHQRTQTLATDNLIPGYSYYSTTADSHGSPRRSGRRDEYRPMEHVHEEPLDEDDMSEWSGYDDDEWEEEQVGRTADFRRAAEERLRQYRREN